MENSKLIFLLKSFDAPERRRFHEFLHSPYFNKHEDLRKLGDALLDWVMRQNGEALPREQVFQWLYPNSAFEESKIYTLASKLLDLARSFLAQEQLREQELLEKHRCLQQLRQRKQEKEYQTVQRQQKRLKERYPYRNTAAFWRHYLYHKEADAFFLEQNKRQYDAHLQEKSEALDAFYLSEKLRIACDMHSRNTIIQADYHCRHLPYLLQSIQEQENQPLPVQLYFCILQSLREPEEEHYYHRLLQLFKNHLDAFPKHEQRNISDYAQNYCIRKINNGRTDYYRAFLDLYKFLLEKEILYTEGRIEEWDYKNIVTVGLRLKDFDWTAQFIERNKGRLEEKLRDNAYTYNLAAYYYATQQYTEALQLLQDVQFSDTSYHLGAKIIQLKSYYEMGESEALLSLLHAFRLFVSRQHDLSSYRQKASQNLIALSKKLLQLRDDLSFQSTAKLRSDSQVLAQRIENSHPLSNADWLREKLQAIQERL